MQGANKEDKIEIVSIFNVNQIRYITVKTKERKEKEYYIYEYIYIYTSSVDLIRGRTFNVL